VRLNENELRCMTGGVQERYFPGKILFFARNSTVFPQSHIHLPFVLIKDYTENSFIKTGTRKRKEEVMDTHEIFAKFGGMLVDSWGCLRLLYDLEFESVYPSADRIISVKVGELDNFSHYVWDLRGNYPKHTFFFEYVRELIIHRSFEGIEMCLHVHNGNTIDPKHLTELGMIADAIVAKTAWCRV